MNESEAFKRGIGPQAAWPFRTTEDERRTFERAISSPPYEKDVARFPDDATKHAWPGSYRDISVDLAWCMWKARAALDTAMKEQTK